MTSSEGVEISAAHWPCPWCKARETAPVWLVDESKLISDMRPDEVSRRFHLRHCQHCEATFTVPHLLAEEMAGYYSEVYYGPTGRRFGAWLEAIVGWFRERRAARLDRLAKRGRMLDIGCGRGWTLAAARKRGWETYGVELNTVAAAHARDILGLNVETAGFVGERWPDAHFDAIILWHVLEHIDDARATLDAVARLLKPGGILALAVPNIDSWQARWTRYAWFHLDLPRHYWHFGADELRTKLAERGLRIVACHHACAEQNVFGWVQSLLNSFGLRHNLLYDLLRTPSARTTRYPWREAPIQSACSLLGLALLVPLAVAFLPIEAWAQRGATIELYAVRETPNE